MAWSCLVVLVLATLAACSPLPGPMEPSPEQLDDVVLARSRPLGLVDAVPARTLGPHARATTRSNRRPAAPRATDAANNPYRLPNTTTATYYDLELTPVLSGNFTFSGEAQIYFNVLEDTQHIVFHSKELKFSATRCKLFLETTRGLVVGPGVVRVTFDEEHEMANLTVKEVLPAGNRYMLRVRYTGKLNDDMDGFYRSSYMVNGERRWLATTQFEPTGAHRAFPCWDEPSHKARFSITINHPENMTAISNMRVRARGSTSTKTVFEDTVPMSTYLVAFVVSDFESVQDRPNNFATWARKELLPGAKISQEIGPQALKLLEQFTGVEYVLPKMDNVAIPDFNYGAMENWGLVTYREESLLASNSTTISRVESIATVICHEFGHQWTGDLVTLDWWSHTWLNEGFATFFESMICGEINPDWNLEDKKVPADYHPAMLTDALENQWAMSSTVDLPAFIMAKFGNISYKKGGSVLRMFYYMLTPEVFKRGLKRYLSVNMFKNTNPEHLFRALGAEADKSGLDLLPKGYSFAEVARTWTEQPGFPLLTVRQDGATLRLSQERHFDVAPGNRTLLDQRWFIPVRVVEQANPDWESTHAQAWVVPGRDRATVTRTGTSDQWFVINPKQTGFFRVLYDTSNWRLLANAMLDDSTVFPAATRAQLINDAFIFASSGRLPYAYALSLLKGFQGEREVAAWQAAIEAFTTLQRNMINTEAWLSLKNDLLAAITADGYDLVGFTARDSDTHEDRYLRYYMTSYACYAGNSQCLADAAQTLQAWLADPTANTLHPDTSEATLCYGMRDADDATFEAMRQLWVAGNDDSYAEALACSTDQTRLQRLLTDVFSGSGSTYTRSHAYILYRSILNRYELRELLLDFTKANVQNIMNTIPFDMGGTLIRRLFGGIRSRSLYNEVRQWVEANFNSQDSNYSLLQEALQTADEEMAFWTDKYYDDVAAWLDNPVVPPPPAPTEGPTSAPPGSSPATPTSTPSGSSATAAVSTAVLAVSWLLSAAMLQW